MSKLISDETLYHYGFKGMKWGFNKGKRNGKRVAEEGEMGPYTKSQQEMIDYHTGLKAHDNTDNPVVGPLTFDSKGKPQFIATVNSEGYGLDEHTKNTAKLLIEKQQVLKKIKTSEIKDFIEQKYRQIMKKGKIIQVGIPNNKKTTKEILDTIRISTKNNNKKINEKKINENKIYEKKMK